MKTPLRPPRLAERLSEHRRAASTKDGSGASPGMPLHSRSGAGHLITDFGQDLRFALRGLARTRAFTIIAVFSLALGIGVNASVFNIVHASWLQPVQGVTDASFQPSFPRSRLYS